MSSNKKRLYTKKLKHSLIFILVFIILGATAITWPIWKSYHKPVEIMKLIQSTDPVFDLSPILPYKHSLTTDFMNNLSSSSSLNLSLEITGSDFNESELLDDLQLLSANNIPILLSLMPSTDVTDETYISIFSTTEDALKSANLKNVQLICYPKVQIAKHTSTLSKSSINKYKKLAPSYVGINIGSSADLTALDKLYNAFSDSATLVVNDTVSTHFTDDIKSGATDLNYIYYTLAIEYPCITTIYSPYMTLSRNKWLKDVDATLLPSLNNRYITTYEHLIEKPWITTKSNEVVDSSPYQALKDYDTLSGQEEIILSPHSALLKEHNDSAKNMIYANYRINAEQFKVQAYYPYELTIDTATLPNGINRFKILAYNDANTVIDAPSIDLIINNDNLTPRAPRLETSYSLNQTPIYTGDYIPILMYHTIADTVAPEDENSCVQTDVFDSQMKALVDNNYTPITFYDLENYLEGNAGLPEKPILITMDDGYLNNYTLAYPVYKKYNISATLFVSPFYMQEQNTDRHFGFAAAREMEQSGLIDIESHGYDHTPFTKLSIRDLKYHISLSKGILEKNLGARDVFTVACPQFRNNYFTRKTLISQDVNFQITKLAKPGTHLKTSHLKRINVPNTMSPLNLITTLETLTQ